MKAFFKRSSLIWTFIFIISSVSHTGCSTKLILKGTANLISPVTPELVHMTMAGINTSYLQGAYGPPGLLALLAGFSEVSPNNYTIAWCNSQIFVATAAYNEMVNIDYASQLAWQGYRFGIRSLMTNADFKEAVEGGMPIEKAVNLLPQKYIEGLTWTSLSLALWMMMNLSDVMAISYAPEVNSMVKRAIALDGEYFHGLPYVLDAVFSAMASEMVLGCGLDQARKSYAKAKEIGEGKFLLLDALYAQLYAVGMRDRKLYRSLLQEVLDAPDDILEYRGFYVTTLAKGRAQFLLENEDLIFENMGTLR